MENFKDVIGKGYSQCPSCESQDWRSARMVVMEGTTFTEGTIDGKVRDPGMFSGGARAFFLSDRWFSWDYDLNADIETTSSTGLVDHVKTFLVKFSKRIPMPDVPPKPVKLSKPARPKASSARSHLFQEIAAAALLCWILSSLIGMWVWVGMLIPFRFLLTKDGVGSSAADRLEEYGDNKNKEAFAQYEEQVRVYSLNNASYDEKMAVYNSYLLRKKVAEDAREALWNHTRVCSRCGEVYLGST